MLPRVQSSPALARNAPLSKANTTRTAGATSRTPRTSFDCVRSSVVKAASPSNGNKAGGEAKLVISSKPQQHSAQGKAGNASTSSNPTLAFKSSLYETPATGFTPRPGEVVLYRDTLTQDQLQQAVSSTAVCATLAAAGVLISPDAGYTLSEHGFAEVATLNPSAADVLGLRDAEAYSAAGFSSSRAMQAGRLVQTRALHRGGPRQAWQQVGVMSCGAGVLQELLSSWSDMLSFVWGQQQQQEQQEGAGALALA